MVRSRDAHVTNASHVRAGRCVNLTATDRASSAGGSHIGPDNDPHYLTTSKMKGRAALALLGLYAQVALCSGLGIADQIRVLGPQAVNLWKLQQRNTRPQGSLLVQDGHAASASTSAEYPAADGRTEESKWEGTFPAHWFSQPLDHFAKERGEQTETWRQRYWINTRHYVPGPDTPVFVIDGGETSGEDRLGFLDTGIAEILARATGGVGVVLEHRCV